MKPDLNKEEFLARCANAWDAGLCTPKRLELLERWVDFVLRFEGGQMNYVADFLEQEKRRTQFRFTLASDDEGYALVRLSAIFTHPCQACATDPDAWWTRPAFCQHKEARKLAEAGEEEE